MVKKEKEKGPIISKDEIVKRKVIIYKESSGEDPLFLKLRHPKHGGDAVYLYHPNEKDSIIQEVLQFKDDKRSYFINNSVSSDGDLHISVPVDPLFLVLPYLEKESRCCPLEQLIQDDDFPETSLLLNCSGIKHISKIADQKGDESINAFVYNEEKALNWLKKKTDRIVEKLKSKNIHVSHNAATSANFVQAEDNKETEESYLVYAFGMISEYLSPDLSMKLSKFLNLPEVEKKTKRKDDAETPDPKRAKIEEDLFDSPVPAPQKKVVPKVNKKSQQMAKAAKGSKAISSFFTKK